MGALEQIFAWLSSHDFYGIPMDIVSHFILAMCFVMVLKLYNVSNRNCILWVAGLSILKELTVDLRANTYNYQYYEWIKDTSVGVLGAATALLLPRKQKHES